MGPLLLAGDGQGLRHLQFTDEQQLAELPASWQPGGRAFASVITQLEDYFAGQRRRFSLPLTPQGTDFQQQLWQQLTRIDFGQTRSYGELARVLGRPGAARAVGLACAANPIAIVIPCHRVLGKDGELIGYAGGLERKAALLRHEGVQMGEQLPLDLG